MNIPYPAKLERLTERIVYLPYHEESDRPILGAVAGARGVLTVDAGASPAHTRLFSELIQKTGTGDITFTVLTHWHWDHVFGLSSLKTLSFAHLETIRRIGDMARLSWSDSALESRIRDGSETEFIRTHMIRELNEKERMALNLKIPDIGFDSLLEISLGDCRAVVQHVGGDHSPDCSIIYIPEERVLFLGDCLYSDIYTDQPRHMEQLYPMLEKILAWDAQWFICSHTPPLTRRQMGEWARELIDGAIRHD